MSYGRQIVARLRIAAALSLPAAAMSCSGEATSPPVPAVSQIQLLPGDTTLIAGRTAAYTARPVDAAGAVMSGQPISWSTSDPTVASVSGGVVTALKAGVATLSAKSGSVEATARVTVVPAVAAVQLTPNPDTVIVAQARQLGVALLDASGAALTGREVAWASSDVSKATVSGSGVVTGVSPGTVTITATSEGKAGTATLVVRPPPVSTVTVSPASVTVVAGNTATLSVALQDASSQPLTDRQVTWSTGNPAIATVNPSGIVTGVAEGTTTITAESEGKTGSATVVVRPAPVNSVTVSPSSLTVGSGRTAALSVVLRDAANQVLTDREVAWSSANPAIATVNASGVVTGVSAGATTITAESEGRKGTATVTVTDATAPQVQGLSISPATVHVSSLARDVTITAQLTDAGGSGVTRLTATGTSPTGTTSTCTAETLSAGTAANGTWTCTLRIPGNTPSGTWGVSLAAADAAGNQVQLSQAALAQAQLPSSFVVNADTQTPSVTSFSVNPDTVHLRSGPRTVRVSVRAADAGSGVVRVEAAATAPGGATKVTCSSTAPTSGTSADGTWTCDLEFPASSTPGNWGLSLLAADAALNNFIVIAGTITVLDN